MRETRNLSNYTKQQISNSLKKYHANKPEHAKKITRERQSVAMKTYWSTIPAGEEINSTIKSCRSNNVQPVKKTE